MSRKVYRNKKFLEFTRHENPILMGTGDTVYHHVKMLGGGGTSLKPSDTHVVPIKDSVHKLLDSPGHSEKSVFLDAGYTPDEVKLLALRNILRYLDKTHNIDGTKLAIDLLTQYMESNNL
jgi:hypothetical protein